MLNDTQFFAKLLLYIREEVVPLQRYALRAGHERDAALLALAGSLLART